MNKDTQYMFWTGGWDSTFMLIQELKKGKMIQPLYVVDNERKGNIYEKKALNTISEMIQKNNCFGGTLLEIKIIDKNKIKKDDEITNAYKRIYQSTKLGSQHDWLARYAKQENIDVMLGTEKGSPETSHIIHALNEFCTLKECEDVTRIDLDKSSNDGQLIFGKMIFPIIHLYETDMLKKVKEWHVEDIMKHIWFCHNPMNGEPCGMCHPCEVKMESDMQFLLPENSQKRYAKFKKIKKTYGDFISKVYRKIYRIFK